MTKPGTGRHPVRFQVKEMLIACPNCIVFMVDVNTCVSLRVNQGLNTFAVLGFLLLQMNVRIAPSISVKN